MWIVVFQIHFRVYLHVWDASQDHCPWLRSSFVCVPQESLELLGYYSGYTRVNCSSHLTAHYNHYCFSLQRLKVFAFATKSQKTSLYSLSIWQNPFNNIQETFFFAWYQCGFILFISGNHTCFLNLEVQWCGGWVRALVFVLLLLVKTIGSHGTSLHPCMSKNEYPSGGVEKDGEMAVHKS